MVERQRSTPAPKRASKEPSSKAGFVPPLTISSAQLLIDGKDDSFREAIYLFVKVLGRFSACRDAFGRAMGLTGSQFAVLIGVAYQQGLTGVSVKQLARHVQLAPTHVTTEVGRLMLQGLLLKRPAIDDKRSVMVSLSADGQTMIRTITPLVRRINDLLFANVTAVELSAAQQTFSKLSRNSDYAIAELQLIEAEYKIVSK